MSQNTSEASCSETAFGEACCKPAGHDGQHQHCGGFRWVAAKHVIEPTLAEQVAELRATMCGCRFDLEHGQLPVEECEWHRSIRFQLAEARNMIAASDARLRAAERRV